MSTATSPSAPAANPPQGTLSESGEKYARQKALRPYLVLGPSFLLTIGILIPFFVAIFYSFTDLTLRSPEFEMVGFQNYVDTFTNPDFWHSVGVTLKYAFIATAVEMVLGMCIALLLNHESAFSRFLRLVAQQWTAAANGAGKRLVR